MAKKIYAVKKGYTTGLFDTWDACKQAVDGYKGAEFKGFTTKQEAEAYLGILESQNIVKAPALEHREDVLVAYVDGSYEHSLKRYGFGCVLITPDGEIIQENGSGDDEDAALIRNVAGELLGAMYATKWAIHHDYKVIEIRHDYEGIAKWITGEWKAKNEMVQQYVLRMNQFRQHINITFYKVKAHSNDKFNDEADKLAKEAVATGKKNSTI